MSHYIKCEVCMDNTSWPKEWKTHEEHQAVNLCEDCATECAPVPWTELRGWIDTAKSLGKNRRKRAVNILRHGDE